MAEVSSDEEIAFVNRCDQIFIQQLGVAPEVLKPEAKIKTDLGADSLDTVELVMAFEEEFNVEISDDDAEAVETVEQARALMARLVSPPTEDA